MQGLSICVVDESQENLEITVHKKGAFHISTNTYTISVLFLKIILF